MCVFVFPQLAASSRLAPTACVFLAFTAAWKVGYDKTQRFSACVHLEIEVKIHCLTDKIFIRPTNLISLGELL